LWHDASCQRLVEQTSKRCGEDGRAETKKPRRYLVKSRRRRVYNQHPKYGHFRYVIQAVECRLFRPLSAVATVGRDSRIG